jgi:hypothetical protein
MDREQFDALTKLFATTGSRRAAFASLLSAALLGTGAEALAKSGKGKHRKPHQDRGHRKGHDQGDGAEQAKPGTASDASADTAPKVAETSTRSASASKDKRTGKGRGQGKRKRGGQQASTDTIPASCCGTKSCSPPTKSSNRFQCDFAGQTLSGTYSGSNLAKIDGRNATFAGNASSVSFANACLQFSTFTANVESAQFGGACLFGADFSQAQKFNSTVFKGGILCQTKVPGGGVRNDDCDKPTTCCQTCVDIGQTGCSAVGGRCCGGSTCKNDTCVCPDNRVPCKTVCCPSGQVCQRGTCVTPCQPQCAGKVCGSDTCGGSCPPGCPTGQTCLGGQCCPDNRVCGATCLAAPCDASRCVRCDPQTGTCGSTCGANETCLGGTCCPTSRVCGTTCLAAPCDTTKCQSCNPATGTCQTGCPAGQTCLRGVECCPHDRVCGNACLAAPCDAAQCLTCDAPAMVCRSMCPDGQKCCNGTCISIFQCCPACPDGTTCLRGVECCPNDRGCGNACLAAPCDATQCLTCNAPGGVCVSSCSGATPACIGGTCRCLPTVPISPCPPSCTEVGPCEGCCGHFCQHDDVLGLICSN